jgi:hypothetical protein
MVLYRAYCVLHNICMYDGAGGNQGKKETKQSLNGDIYYGYRSTHDATFAVENLIISLEGIFSFSILTVSS